jgi:hypothetical protein
MNEYYRTRALGGKDRPETRVEIRVVRASWSHEKKKKTGGTDVILPTKTKAKRSCPKCELTATAASQRRQCISAKWEK